MAHKTDDRKHEKQIKKEKREREESEEKRNVNPTETDESMPSEQM